MPIYRLAEAMTVFAVLTAGLFPLIHLGRVWFFYWLIPYPNSRLMWPNFRSPLLWDLTAIITYVTGSAIYLYLPLIPDMAQLAAHNRPWRRKLYRMLSLGWTGQPSSAELKAGDTLIGRIDASTRMLTFTDGSFVSLDIGL